MASSKPSTKKDSPEKAKLKRDDAMRAMGAFQTWCIVRDSASSHPSASGLPLKTFTDPEVCRAWLPDVKHQYGRVSMIGPRWAMTCPDGKIRFVNVTALELTNAYPLGHPNHVGQDHSDSVIPRQAQPNRNRRKDSVPGVVSSGLSDVPSVGDPRPEPPDDGPPW